MRQTNSNRCYNTRTPGDPESLDDAIKIYLSGAKAGSRGNIKIHEQRSREFREFIHAVENPLHDYILKRRAGNPRPPAIGTAPLPELLLDGHSWEPRSIKVGLGEVGTSYDSRYPEGLNGTHGSDSLVIMMQSSHLYQVPVYIGTLAYIHDISAEIKAYAHFLRVAPENFVSLEHRLPEQQVYRYSLIGGLYLPTPSFITPQQFVEEVKAYRGRRPIRDAIQSPPTTAHLGRN